MQLIGGWWPEEWKPRGFSSLDVEPFNEWWTRHGEHFPNVDPRVVEQWVYRHWTYSPYWGFPIHAFHCRMERLPTALIVSGTGSVDHRRPGDIAPPADVYAHLNGPGLQEVEPMKTMNQTGSWNFPIVLIRNTSGFKYRDEKYPDFQLWLLEGHLRQRYLRAIAHVGNAAPMHEAFVLFR